MNRLTPPATSQEQNLKTARKFGIFSQLIFLIPFVLSPLLAPAIDFAATIFDIAVRDILLPVTIAIVSIAIVLGIISLWLLNRALGIVSSLAGRDFCKLFWRAFWGFMALIALMVSAKVLGQLATAVAALVVGIYIVVVFVRLYHGLAQVTGVWLFELYWLLVIGLAVITQALRQFEISSQLFQAVATIVPAVVDIAAWASIKKIAQEPNG